MRKFTGRLQTLLGGRFPSASCFGVEHCPSHWPIPLARAEPVSQTRFFRFRLLQFLFLNSAGCGRFPLCFGRSRRSHGLRPGVMEFLCCSASSQRGLLFYVRSTSSVMFDSTATSHGRTSCKAIFLLLRASIKTF